MSVNSPSKIFTPRPYQDLIINHEIDTLRCNIWAGMGMGKTVATLTALEDLFMTILPPSRTLFRSTRTH